MFPAFGLSVLSSDPEKQGLPDYNSFKISSLWDFCISNFWTSFNLMFFILVYGIYGSTKEDFDSSLLCTSLNSYSKDWKFWDYCYMLYYPFAFFLLLLMVSIMLFARVSWCFSFCLRLFVIRSSSYYSQAENLTRSRFKLLRSG